MIHHALPICFAHCRAASSNGSIILWAIDPQSRAYGIANTTAWATSYPCNARTMLAQFSYSAQMLDFNEVPLQVFSQIRCGAVGSERGMARHDPASV